MSKSQVNLQDLFLNQLRKEAIPVTLYLISGVQLRGHIKGFDAFTVILEGQGKPPQLVYKHSIVSVAPQRHPSGIFEEDRKPAAQPAPAPAPPAEATASPASAEATPAPAAESAETTPDPAPASAEAAPAPAATSE